MRINQCPLKADMCGATRDVRFGPKADIATSFEAASLLPPQIAMAEQLGLRKIIEDRATPEVVHGYMRALDRAEQALEEDLAKYLPLWKLSVPAEFESFYPWDFSKFGRGERFINATLPREEFSEVFAQVERWGLDQYLKDRSPETLSYPT
jgi:hypothetical protein